MDVHEKRPKRTPRVVKSDFLPEERRCYNEIIGFAGEWYDRRSGLGLMDLYGDKLVEWFKKNVDPEATSRTVARDLFANGFAVTML